MQQEKSVSDQFIAAQQFFSNRRSMCFGCVKPPAFSHGRTASSSELKDADNKPFIKEILAKAGSVGHGRVDYKWANPVSKAIQQKSAYLKKAEDVVIATGFYKK